MFTDNTLDDSCKTNNNYLEIRYKNNYQTTVEQF